MAPPKIEAWGETSSFGQKLRESVVKFGHKLNFDQFSQVVVSVLEPAGASSSAGTLALAAREAGKPQTLSTTLRARFDLIDADNSGTISVSECLRFMLREALAATATQVTKLLDTWDEDKNGQISRIEFRSALKALGLSDGMEKADVDAVFDDFDTDRSGDISLPELRTKLRQYAGLAAENKIPLRKAGTGHKSKVVAALDAESGDVRSQLKAALQANLARVIDLFRDWDENGDGPGAASHEAQAPPHPDHRRAPLTRVSACRPHPIPNTAAQRSRARLCLLRVCCRRRGDLGPGVCGRGAPPRPPRRLGGAGAL